LGFNDNSPFFVVPQWLNGHAPTVTGNESKLRVLSELYNNLKGLLFVLFLKNKKFVLGATILHRIKGQIQGRHKPSLRLQRRFSSVSSIEEPD